MKLAILRLVPWWVLRCAWRLGLVERTTVFRWEMNLALGEWKAA